MVSLIFLDCRLIFFDIEPTPDLRPEIPKGQASLVLSLLSPDA